MAAKVFGISFALIIVIILPLLASTSHSDYIPADSALKGILVCRNCDVQAAEGTAADCGTYGHNYALKLGAGCYVDFLKNQHAEGFVTGEKYVGKKLVIHGHYYSAASLVDVESFEVDGTMISWCDKCGAMDGCAAQQNKSF